MPILAAEPMVFPDDLFDRKAEIVPTPDCENAAKWWVAHTKPRQEKALARYLRGEKTSYFLPQFEKTTRRNRHRLRSWHPVFPGYLFFLGDERVRVDALKSNRIATLLETPDSIALDSDLRRVYRLVTSDLPLFPEQRLAEGARVRIVSGPLTGLDGVIERRQGATRFVVTVTFIRQGVSAEVDAREVEPITDD